MYHDITTRTYSFHPYYSSQHVVIHLCTTCISYSLHWTLHITLVTINMARFTCVLTSRQIKVYYMKGRYWWWLKCCSWIEKNWNDDDKENDDGLVCVEDDEEADCDVFFVCLCFVYFTWVTAFHCLVLLWFGCCFFFRVIFYGLFSGGGGGDKLHFSFFLFFFHNTRHISFTPCLLIILLYDLCFFIFLKTLCHLTTNLFYW